MCVCNSHLFEGSNLLITLPFTEEEIAKLVDELMAGKTKPSRLVRVGNTLYKRLADAVEGSDGTRPGTAPQAAASSSPPALSVTGGAAGRAAAGATGSGSHLTLQVLQDPLGVGLDSPGMPRPVTSPPTSSDLEAGQAAGVVSQQSVGTSPSATRGCSTAGAVLPQVASQEEGPSSSSLVHPRVGLHSVSRRETSPTAGILQEARDSHLGLLVAEASAGPSSPIHLLRPRSPSTVVPANGPRMSASTAGPPGGAGLLGGFVMDLGLATQPGWKEAKSSSDLAAQAEEEAAAAARIAAAAAASRDTDEDLCIICYDLPPSCVFLECGHGGFCKRCAYLLFVRPPGECPTCRQAIEQVVELTEVTVPIGEVSNVK